MNANQMKVLLPPRRAAPVVAFMVVYRVGSRTEAVGYTGSTHLLEHMMFKGTPTFNKQVGTQIAAVLQKCGALFNADTWYDRTRYFEMLPSDQLELAVHLEADRMRNSFIADEDRQSEMTVVRNELERSENDPGTILDERVWAIAFREHPISSSHHRLALGCRRRARLRASKSSTTLTIIRTMRRRWSSATSDEQAALDLIATHFGAIPASPHPIPPMYTTEPMQEGENRFTLRRAGQLGVGRNRLAHAGSKASRHGGARPCSIIFSRRA